MECPFCYTNFEYHLSICTSCGKDTDDPLYQELFSRVKPRKIEQTAPVVKQDAAPEAAKGVDVPLAATVIRKEEVREKPAVTSEIRSKNTCNTLVDFPGKKAELPEWRLELQSRLKDIQDQRKTAEPSTEAIPAKRHAIGGTGLAMAVLEAPETPTHPLMQRALERIERSRLKNEPQSETKSYTAPASYAPYAPATYKPAAYTPAAYAPSPETPQTLPRTPLAAPKIFPRVVTLEEVESESGVRPFIYSENETVETRLSQIGLNHAERLAEAAKIKNDLIAAGEKFCTNKLHKPEAAASFPGSGPASVAATALKREEIANPEPKAIPPVEDLAAAVNFGEDEAEEIAPFAYRFNAGLFDFIISGFLSLILLSPFMVLGGGNLFTIEGLFAFLATCSIVMFLYITAAVGLIGRTLGMGLFSLEMIDASDNDYPTFHQAAVSSSLYLVSLALGGIGFATMFWNDEKRAVHDLVSGTIVVRET